MLRLALIWIMSAANRIRSRAQDREYARTDPLKLWHPAGEQAVVDRQKNDPAKPRDRAVGRRVLTADRPAAGVDWAAVPSCFNVGGAARLLNPL